ncbi:ATP dependent DNA ligase [Rhodococcus globerulus]|uniref:ATP dependent DNA ligase n=1 Tax=Rhodococcus globerulus TaxID=33008 RepID=UPI003556CC24
MRQTYRDRTPHESVAVAPPRAIAREARWAEPLLVCDVEYREFTGDSLRHPAFTGLRVDKTAGEVKMSLFDIDAP